MSNGSAPRPPKTKQAPAPKPRPFNASEQLAMAKALRRKKPKQAEPIDAETSPDEE